MPEVEVSGPKHSQAAIMATRPESEVQQVLAARVVCASCAESTRLGKPSQKRQRNISLSPTANAPMAEAPPNPEPLKALLKFRPGPALFNSPRDKIALDGKQRELRGLAKVRDRGSGLSEFGDKCATHGVVEMIPFEHGALPDVVERVQSGLRAVDVRDGDGSVHRRDR